MMFSCNDSLCIIYIFIISVIHNTKIPIIFLYYPYFSTENTFITKIISIFVALNFNLL